MMPSCDQIGVPIHFHSSTTSGSASLMSLRILPRVFPRQSPSSAILFEMSSDADWPWLAPDFFMFSSEKFHQICPCDAQLYRRPKAGRCKLMLDGSPTGQLMTKLRESEPQHLCKRVDVSFCL